MAEKCCNCERSVRVYWYCDQEGDGPWCDDCWPSTACGNGVHGEGCPTKVFDTE